ncbi:Ig-like domain-containing protein [Candidatus Palauibacter sp.]|uniref:Ig-like domain-containing protein n=1 Tax=Candidatus Palauibacter sp. TaxID=3101350 RepID=UPI003B5AF8F6
MKTNRYRTVAIVSALVAALGGGVSCGGGGTTDPPPLPPLSPPPPVAPVTVGSIPAQVMTEGQSVTVDVSPFFRDPDGGTLTYAAASSAEAVLTVSLTGSNLSITAVARGTATVTVTATDPDGLTATQSAGVTVEAANQAPEAVGTIPAQAITVGQTATVNVASFFSDPDGDALGYSAASSAAGVVSVSMSGSVLTLVGVADGTATVTVTARDPEGLTAAQNVAVTVEAANQAPEAVGTIPAQSLNPGQSQTIDVSPYFRDPDGDVLTYSAATSNALATASVSGSRVTVIGVADGTATVTVTASDPGRLTASQTIAITVAASTGFRDDFDSIASLDDWGISDADATVADGLLRLTPTTDDRLGIAWRPLEPALTEWTIRARMGRGTGEGWVRVYWLTGDDSYPVLGFSLGPAGDHNFRFLFFDAEEGGWFFTSDVAGNSDAVRDEPGDFTNLTLGHDGAEVFVEAGDTELLRFTPAAAFRPALQNVTEVWLAGTENGSAVHFDWVHVAGAESSAATSSATTDIRDLVEHAADVTERVMVVP